MAEENTLGRETDQQRGKKRTFSAELSCTKSIYVSESVIFQSLSVPFFFGQLYIELSVQQSAVNTFDMFDQSM